MARSRTEFEVTITGLTIKYKGDIENGQIFGAAVSQNLANLAGLPSQFMALEDQASSKALPASAITVASTDANDKQSTTEKPSKSPKSRAAKSEGPQVFIEKLVADGYFAQERSADDVTSELSKKGHAYESGALSMPLTRITKKGLLERNKRDKGSFMYSEPKAK